MSYARSVLRIAAVQCVSHPGDVLGTVAEHVGQIADAARNRARVVLFPELSLTGYEPDLIDLHGLRIGADDPILQPLSAVCREHRVHALVGAPTPGLSLPQIGMLHIDHRGGVRVVYTKQNVHIGEVGLFAAGRAPGMIEIEGWRLALSICFDAAVPSHPAAAAAAGAHAYLNSAMHLIGAEQRIVDQMHLATRAGLWAVMSQYSGGTGGGPACGGSGGWRPDGSEAVRLGAGPGTALVDLVP